MMFAGFPSPRAIVPHVTLAMALLFVGPAGCGSAPQSGDQTAPAGFPKPVVGGSPALDALANAPARCGQAPYVWLRDGSLGEIRDRVQKQALSADLLKLALSTQGIEVPRPLQYDADVDQIRYLTQDRGKLLEATALVGYPVAPASGSTTTASTAPLDVLLFLHGTSGFADACAPSLDVATQDFIGLLASMGYLVVAPDYIGLKGSGPPTGFYHPYLVGQATAIASLDAVRAAGRLPWKQLTGRSLRPRVVVVGGSQGGHAALWVDRLAPYYAPELTLLGTAATVPPANLEAEAVRALQTPVEATANTVAFLDLAAYWYGAADELGQVFTDQAVADLSTAFQQDCTGGHALDKYTSLDQLFQPAVLNAAQSGSFAGFNPWGCFGLENSLTSTSIARRAGAFPSSYGILWVLGGQDDLVNTPIERQSFQTLCAQGMPLQFLECAGASHTATTYWALPEILDFIDARLAGEPMDPTKMCQLADPVTCRGTPNP